MSEIDNPRPFEIDVVGDVATLWLNRPAKRNAVTFEMWEQLPSVLDEILTHDVRVLIVRGRGGHFCAGADITGIGRNLGDAGVPGGYRDLNARAEQALADFPLPTIALIEGNCIGGGWQIASACDLRMAGRSVLFGITPAKLGISYPSGCVERTVALVGPSTTKRMLFTAELIDAEEAFRLGFFDYLIDDESLVERSDALCDELRSRSLLTQVATKANVNALVEGNPALDDIIARYEALAVDNEDLLEGLAAFGERRVATFTWRPIRN